MSSLAAKPARLDSKELWPTVRASAKRAGMGERAIRSAIQRGELTLYRIPNTWPRLHWPDVETWMRSFRVVVDQRADARVREICARRTSGTSGKFWYRHALTSMTPDGLSVLFERLPSSQNCTETFRTLH